MSSIVIHTFLYVILLAFEADFYEKSVESQKRPIRIYSHIKFESRCFILNQLTFRARQLALLESKS